MTITDRHQPYAAQISETLKREGLRLEEDFRNEKIGFKIREARNQKTPYMIIIGDKEMSGGTLSVRKRGEQTTSELTLEEFLSRFRQEVENRT